MALRRLLQPAGSALLRCQSAQVSTAACALSPESEFADHPKVGKGGWGQTRIADVLQAKVQREDQGAWLWCSQDDLVADAVRKMTRANVGSLLVFDPEKLNLSPPEADNLKAASQDAVVGIVTERDYLTKVFVAGKQSNSTHVREIMTPQSKMMTMSPQQSVADAMALMTANNFRHVPVVSEGNYLGMISIRDTVQVMVAEHKSEVKGLQEYIQGSY